MTCICACVMQVGSVKSLQSVKNIRGVPIYRIGKISAANMLKFSISGITIF